ncbi:MAG TPA: VOC family protein [Acidimicrobiales bacterium]|nr:VOC family protein [Acidimicrobiales bacterium]
MPVRSLGYIRIGTEDMDAWRRFAGELLGMESVRGDNPEAAYFRMDDHPHRLVISPAPQNRVDAIGFQVGGPEELAQTVAAVEETGTKVTALDQSACRDRRVTEGVSFDDPAGNQLELFWGVALAHSRASTPLVSGFVTGDQGMGHVVLTVGDGPAAYDFYTRALGFRGRNTMRLPAAPAPDGSPRFETLWFLGCNPRHHTVGLLPMDGPGRMIHFMVEAATLDDIGRAWDRAERLEVPVMQTLGRHTNDRMVSFYVIGPGGFAVEFGYDGLRVTEEEPVYEITEGEFWGHKFINFPTL